jgi:hypothetical protein
MAHCAKATDEDLQDEALVLDRLLVHWPTHLQEPDLQRELQAQGSEFQQRDRVERAVHHLWWAGLVLRCGQAVVPTRAALHYHLLSDETTIDL